MNGGNLIALSGRSRQSTWQDFTTSFRWSVGGGIVWPTIVGKLELNAVRVLTCQPHDRVRMGLQFGFVPPSW